MIAKSVYHCCALGTGVALFFTMEEFSIIGALFFYFLSTIAGENPHFEA